MATYTLKIADGKDAEVSIHAENDHEALNDGLNALAKFACRRFPPPEKVTVSIAREDGARVATLAMAFTIDLAPGVSS
jgi:hypothetical protein